MRPRTITCPGYDIESYIGIKAKPITREWYIRNRNCCKKNNKYSQLCNIYQKIIKPYFGRRFRLPNEFVSVKQGLTRFDKNTKYILQSTYDVYKLIYNIFYNIKFHTLNFNVKTHELLRSDFFSSILPIPYTNPSEWKFDTIGDFLYHQEVYYLLQSIFIDYGVPKDIRNIILCLADIRVPCS